MTLVTGGDEVGLLLRTVLGLTLLVAAFAKLSQKAASEPTLGSAMPMPHWLQVAASIYETVLAALLLSGRWLNWVNPVAFATFVSFLVYGATEWVRRKPHGCACFGSISSGEPPWFRFVRNLALVCMAMLLIIVARSHVTAQAEIIRANSEATDLFFIFALSASMVLFLVTGGSLYVAIQRIMRRTPLAEALPKGSITQQVRKEM